MKFKIHYLAGIKTPILLPENYKLIDVKDSYIKCIDVKTGEHIVDELLFYHGKDRVFPSRFKPTFPNDSVIIILISPNKKLYLQIRGMGAKWSSMKIDLASVAGQRRAILVGDHFENEDPKDAALREIAEETGIKIERLSKDNLYLLGAHYNPQTNEYQTIYAYKINVTLEELNKNLAKSPSREVEKWIEQDYYQTLKEYFGEEVEKYAGGAKMRPVNFISDPNIRKKIEEFLFRE
jgi:ADP-ribose pyrophosphatase YjhB (NUDIX family)